MEAEDKKIHTSLQIDVAKLTVKVENVLFRLEEVLNTIKEFATQRDLDTLSKRLDTLENKKGQIGFKALEALITAAIVTTVALVVTQFTS